MTEQEFKRFMHSATPETPRGIDLQDQRPRTLIYGYTVDRHSFHLYLDEECRLQRVIYDHHDVLLSTCSENHLTWHDCRPDKAACPESCDLEFCKMLESAGIEMPFTGFDAVRAYKLQGVPFHGKQSSELKKRAEASPSTIPAYVLYSDTLGVYLCNILGLGFWSKLDPFELSGATTFESPDRVREFLATWGRPPPEDVRVVAVKASANGYATMADCVAAGLPAWDTSGDDEPKETSATRTKGMRPW